MRMEFDPRWTIWCTALALSVLATSSQGASPTVEQALSLTPIQKDVDCDRPQGDEVARCRISSQKIDGYVGWVVEDANGVILRRFLDTNGDNKVDQWSYYKGGLEVYRDLDGNFNGKADQYRWFYTGGSRWGVDRDEDGRIDQWRFISAEEVTAEVIAALAEKDVDRFLHVALGRTDVGPLGLGPTKSKDLAAKIEGLETKFKDLLAKQKAVTAATKWVQFSGSRPGVIPAKTAGSTQDVQVYENVVAIVQTGTAHGQVQIGTLVLAPGGWRVIDVPQPIAEGQTEMASGFFFQIAPPERAKTPTVTGPSEEVQKLMAAIEEVDKAASQAATVEEKAKHNGRKADLLEQLATQSKPDERAMWYRQLADTISASVQSGAFPDGVKRLQALFDKLAKAGEPKAIVAHVRFAQMAAEYGLAIQDKKADYATLQSQWLKKLEGYIADYPDCPDTAEAMFQLAVAQEYAGQEEDATKWYGKIVKDFPTAPAAKKAAGARNRLGSVGNTISIVGKSPSGKTVDTADYRGKVVLVQYWATWCEPCKADMPMLKELLSKYGAGFTIVGVNLDQSAKDMADYVSQNSLTWPQIHEEGGLESRPANEMGILTLPTMILLDGQGKVVNRNIHVAELDREVKKLMR